MTSKYLQSSQHFVWLGKLFGVSFFSLAGHGGDHLEVLYCVPFFVFFAYVYNRAFVELDAYGETHAESETSTAAINLILTQHLVSQVFKAIYFWYRRRTFKSAFLKVQALGEFLKLREEDGAMQGARVGGHLAVAVVLNVYVETLTQSPLWIVFAHHLFYFVGYVEIAVMYKMLNELARQCRSINEHLQRRIGFLALDEIRAKGKIWHELLDVKKLRQSEKDAFFDGACELAEAHLAIGQVAREINAVFAASCLLGVLSDFTMLTCTTVSFCQDIRQLLNVGTVHFVIMLKAFNNAFHDALILIKECYSIYYWTKLKDTLKETITCLHKMWNTLAKHNEIDEKSNYLQLLIVQLFNGIPNFSAFGIVVLDWPLIIYVISSAATYVVIIMQFDLATKTSPSPTALGNVTAAAPRPH